MIEVKQTKKSMLRWVAVLALLSAGACVSLEAYRTELDTWIGKTEDELLRQFGPPVSSTDDGSAKTLRWEGITEEKSTSSSSGGGFTVGIGMTTQYRCSMTFRMVDGVAESVEYEALQSKVFGEGFRDAPVATQCARLFPTGPRTANEPWEEMDRWVGRSEDELLGAYDDEPQVYERDASRRFLTWQDSEFGRPVVSTAGTKDDPDASVTTRSRAVQCAVTFAVADGVVESWDYRGARRQCRVPLDQRD